MLLIKKIVFVWLSIIFLLSCSQKKEKEKWHHIEISPLDDTQFITIITDGEKRYIMNGKHENIPKDNYLLLDLSKVDRLGDGISICWNDNGYEWKIASAYATLIENKLDTNKYLYYQPLGEFGQPISDGYTNDNCGGILIREMREPRGDLKIKYIVD